MGTTFERWEKDPFFSSAEEVQDSADRLESIFRKWMKESKDAAKASGGSEFATAGLKWELSTALGTAKWQLEELDKAVRTNDEVSSAGEDTRVRHGDFVSALGSRISTVESCLRETILEAGESTLGWTRLDESERDELAHFLLPSSDKGRESTAYHRTVRDDSIRMNIISSINCSKDYSESNELCSLNTRDGTVNCPRRIASCAGNIGIFTITIPSEGEDASERSSDDRPNLLPRVVSFSALSSTLDSTSKMRWPKNGFRKCPAQNQDDAIEAVPPRNHEPSQGANLCFERSKSYLSRYERDTYNKHLYGYLGAFRRLLQRSQYQTQYDHRIKYSLLIALVILLIVILVLLARK